MATRKRLNHDKIRNKHEEYNKETDVSYNNKHILEQIKKLKRAKKIRKDNMNIQTHFFICSKIFLFIVIVTPIVLLIYFILTSNSINQNEIFYLKQAIKASLIEMNPKDLVIKSIHDNIDKNIFDKNIKKQGIHVIAFGKAALPMVLAAETELGKYISSSIASIPYDINVPKVANLKTIFLNGAKDNLPDKASLETTKRIYDFINNIPEKDTVLILISGGGSALLTAPIPGVTLEEKYNITKLVTEHGANIRQLNVIRQALSTLKGGQLAEKLYPRKIISLVLSDIVGDPIQYIASGPTYISESSKNESRRLKRYQEAIDILKKLNLYSSISYHILEAMKKHAYDKNNLENKTILNDGRVKNYIIGNNKKALQILRDKLIYMPEDYLIDEAVIVTDSLEEDVKKLAINYCDIITNYIQSGNINLTSIVPTTKTFKMNLNQKRIAFLFGGEWTIKLNKKIKNSIGGRNQNLVLQILNNLIIQIYDENFFEKRNFRFLSINTDGFDGPTTAAGAMINDKDVMYFLSQKSNGKNKQASNNHFTIDSIVEHLANENSFDFWANYKNGRNHIVTGRTNTNFMDISIIILEQNS